MKKVFILFMSHRSGEHGLTIHNTLEEVREEVKSVVEIIKEGVNGDIDDERNEEYHSDLMIVKAINEDTADGFYSELSDSTWFDVFEREV